LLALLFAPYLGRVQADQTGENAERATRFLRWFGAILVAVTLLDYGAVLVGWGSALQFMGVR
jgi:hypothetical protein